MHQRREFRPSLGQSLEKRLVLSSSALTLAPALIESRGLHHKHLFLVGRIDGTTRTDLTTPPDAGSTIELHGSGRVQPLGRVSSNGSLLEAGFIRMGRDEGLLTLANARGSVTIRFDRPFVAGGAGHSGRFRFVIKGGTGAYKGANGSGTAQLAFGGPILCVRGFGGPCRSTEGSFALALNTTLTNVVLPLALPAGQHA